MTAYNQQAINLIWSELASRGVKPQVAAGVIAGIMGESGAGIDPTAFNAKDPGGGAGGILQWNRDRLVGDHGLLAFARANGVDVDTNTPTDSKKVPLAVQVKFMGHELDGRYNGVLKGLQVVNNGEEGLNTWVDNMEVPLDKAGAKAQRHQYIAPVSGLLGAPAPVSANTAGGGSTAPVAAAQTPPPNPWAVVGSSLGEALGRMSNSMSGAPAISEPPDQPAIRSMAAQTDFTAPPTNPVPQTLAGGIAPTLGSLAVQPQPLPTAVEDPGSITQGAPSMTAMLGGVGTANDPTLIDPRRTGSINPYTRPLTRLG